MCSLRLTTSECAVPSSGVVLRCRRQQLSKRETEPKIVPGRPVSYVRGQQAKLHLPISCPHVAKDVVLLSQTISQEKRSEATMPRLFRMGTFDKHCSLLFKNLLSSSSWSDDLAVYTKQGESSFRQKVEERPSEATSYAA